MEGRYAEHRLDFMVDPEVTDAEEVRIMSRVVVVEGCWVWAGPPNGSGYATAVVGGRVQGLHRAMYEHRFGPIRPGLVVDHLCKTRLCINPDHLEPVTQKENLRRGAGPPNRHKTHCPRGHELSGDNMRVESSGGGRHGRRCLVCQRDRSRERKLAKEAR